MLTTSASGVHVIDVLGPLPAVLTPVTVPNKDATAGYRAGTTLGCPDVVAKPHNRRKLNRPARRAQEAARTMQQIGAFVHDEHCCPPLRDNRERFVCGVENKCTGHSKP